MLPISDGSAFDQLKLLVDREGDNLAGPDWLDPLSDLTTYSGVPPASFSKNRGMGVWHFDCGTDAARGFPMTPSRLLAMCVTFCLLGIPLIANGGAGDPRLVNGVVEWPAVVSNEPFLIVRGDNGALYYVGIAGARREDAVAAGSRVSVLGLEGRNPHEITAVAMGCGPSAEAALAQLLESRPATIGPATPAPAPAAAPAPVPAPAHDTGTSVTSSPAAPAASAPPAAPASRQPSAPSPKVTADARPPAVTPAVVPASTTPPTEVATVHPSSVATPPMLVPSGDQRWIELVGEVETLVGRVLVLKVDGGRVNVDVSSLRANLGPLAPGSVVKVYGVPVELRFKAMGFIDPDARAQRPPQN